MRNLIVCNIISLDGFFAGPGDDVMALPFDEGFSDYNVERLRAADTLLLGRRTFDGFKAYWPSVADDPNQPAVEREISRLNSATEKVVVSDTLLPADTAPWTNTRIVPRADAQRVVRELKEVSGRDIVVFGSHTLWNALLVAGLVDELHLMIGAAMLGAGIPVFESTTRADLSLLEARRLSGSELVLVRYRPRG